MIRLIYFLSILCMACSACYAQNDRIYLIPALHSFHRSNQNYNYDSLRAIVGRLHPDVIAVEIRPEDISADSAYLSHNYPYEMIMMRYWFPGITITGFDWLGSDIEGKSIPADYWKRTAAIKQWERALDADSSFSKKNIVCDSFSQKRLPILKSASLKQLLEGNDSLFTRQFYDCLRAGLNGSIHQRIIDFYDLRNEKMLQRIQMILSEYRKKTIVIITGDDHYVMLSNRFSHARLFE